MAAVSSGAVAIQRQLEALGCPFLDVGLDLTLASSLVRQIVLWAEDQKIRLRKVEDRASLRAIEEDGWPNVFVEYLRELEYPRVGSTTLPGELEVVHCLQWILGEAVASEFEDGASAINSAATALLISPQQERAALVSSLCERLGVSVHGGSTTLEQLRLLASAVDARCSGTSDDGKKVVAATGSCDTPACVNLRELSLGFGTGDSAVDDAARVLKLLYINDLRQLQSGINAAIVECQQWTMDPKFDSKLGKVGY